ncbi:MAG: hypothetical protein ACFFCO_05935 [Promethearchaeota archaeon]
MRKQTTLLIGLALLISLVFLNAHSTAQAQAVFPIGLNLEYDCEVDNIMITETYTWEFEALGWELPNILNVRSRTDGGSWVEGYVDVTDWEVTDSDGTGLGYHFFPPQYLTVAALIVGTEVELTAYTTDIDFVVQVDTMVVVPAGSFMCKHLRYTDSDSSGDFTMDLYYETSLGVLVKYYEFLDSAVDPMFDSLFDCELSAHNMANYLIFGMPPATFFLILAVVVIVIVVVVIVVVVVVIRRRG